jgi:long-chain acyl-CoA synthetase
MPLNPVRVGQQQVGKTQRLSAVEVAPVLPRSAIGKVLKRELREQYARRGIME